MWPKRKKKGRASKAKLKTVKPGGKDDELDVDLESEADAPEGEQENRPDDLFSGVWKSKVLQTYKKNPRDSHTLLAKVPTGSASLEAGPREKGELIRESMIEIIDRMFDSFQNTAYEFNQVTGGSDLELSWIRPCLTRERVSEWHSGQYETTDLFSGRISTRYWTLVVRGTVNGITAFILPADKMLAFNTEPGQFKTYLRMLPSSDGFKVDWLIGRQEIALELMPSVYRALLDGLVRFANEEASGDDCFMLSDIGIAPETSAPQALPQHMQDDGTVPLQGQGSFQGQPSEPAFPGVIDKLSSRVANEAEAETDRVRQSMRAESKESTSNARGSSEFSTDYKASGIFGESEPAPFQGTAAQKVTGEWKTISTVPSQSTDWRKFMAASQSAQKNSPARSPQDVPWQPVESNQKVISETNLPSAGRRGPQDEHQSRQFSSRNVVSQQSTSQPSEPPKPIQPTWNETAPMPEVQEPKPIQPTWNDVTPKREVQEPKPIQPTWNDVTPKHDMQEAKPIQPTWNETPKSDAQEFPSVPPPPPPGMLETVDRDSFGLTQLPPGSLQSSAQRQPAQVQPSLQLGPVQFQESPQSMQQSQQFQLPPMHQSQQMQSPQLPPLHQSQQMQAPLPPMNLSQQMQAPQLPPMNLSQQMQAPQMPQMTQQLQLPNQFQASQQMPHNGNPYGQSAQQQMPPQQMPPQHNQFSQQANYGLGFPAQQGGLPPGYEQPNFPPGWGPQQGYPPGYPPAPPAPPALSQGFPPTYQQDPNAQLQQAPPGFPPSFTPQPPVFPQSSSYSHSDGQPQEGAETGEESQPEPYDENDGQSYQGDYPEYQGDGQSYDEDGEQQTDYNYEQAYPEAAQASEVSYAEGPSGFPNESYVGLPAMMVPQVASYAQLGTPLPDDVRLAADPDLADALTVLLSTIDKQIEALTRQGGEAFVRRDFRQAESIVRLSERLTNFKSEALLLLEAIEPSVEEE